ncbi:CHAP domain-containing protein [Burkholderia ubonensis]|nr:CHAP domain-containing protein [Burkholderia ubonensis]RQP37299.1 CHAP domain-containing protein [Burkholderia ubonensis]RQP40960.1 CHAP domain-containing protein [Burkholderia ubonensis]RQP52725.1 CHAP domain-containing protein [Burkholderia ubonensis]RQP54355.1 CHAP domain-containing protein [Burkholderia ubonensis]
MHDTGDVVDEINGVKIYYNGAINSTSGRNLSTDGYNIGIKYQCVEFVKRYYYEHLGHKMPESRGNAKDYFDNNINDGETNKARNLIQFTNSSNTKPAVDDIVVFRPWIFNRYGHVAIISNVTSSTVEIIQQNPGPFGKSREIHHLTNQDGKWKIDNDRLLGWLRIRDRDARLDAPG